MARSIRIQSAGAYDHFMVRGNRTAATQGATPGPVRTTGYPATNALNQYKEITNPRVLEVSGTIASGFTPEVKVNGNVQTLDSAGTGEPGSFRAEAATLADGLWQRVEISATKVSTGETVSISDGHRYTPPANEAPDHDLDGNLTEDARWTYTWDAENRMIGAEEKPRSGDLQSPPLPARKRLTFAYDHRHRRIAKTVHEWEGDATTGGFTKLVKDLRFLYDEWNLTLELDHTFATGSGLAGSKGVRACYWGPDLSGTLQGAGGVGGLLAVCTPGGILLPCTDTNGNIKGLVSATDTTISGLTARYDYDPFGNRITDTGPGVELCPFGFSTKYRDEETGMYYYGYRYYSPETGRWPSPDPIGESGGINLYGMVGNDPVNRVDVLGLEERSLVFVSGPDGTGLSIPSASGIAPASPAMETLATVLTRELGWRPKNATLMNGFAVGTEQEMNKHIQDVISEGKCIHKVTMKYKYAPTATEAKTFLNQMASAHIVLAHGDVDKNGQTGLAFQVPGATWQGKNVAAVYSVSSIIPEDTSNLNANRIGVACCQAGSLPKKIGDVSVVSLAGNYKGSRYEGVFWTDHFKPMYRCLCGAPPKAD